MTAVESYNPDRMTKVIRIVLIIWSLLQLPRFIAIPLIGDVMAGTESPAWLYPAILDVVVALSAPIVAYLLWKEQNMRAWMLGIVFLVVSIIDHGGSVTADILSATPQIFGGEDGPNPMVISSAQGVIDLLMLWLLLGARMQNYYLKNAKAN